MTRGEAMQNDRRTRQREKVCRAQGIWPQRAAQWVKLRRKH
jgi:hypothetical protein